MMEIFQQLDKENGNLCFSTSKAKRVSSALSSRGSKQQTVKCINVSKTQSQRKVLGILNQNVSDKSNSTKAKKQETMCHRREKYPDIETFIPYNPLDYERFDIPEEHRLSDSCLAGVPLFISVHNVKRFDAFTSPTLLAMDDENISYDSYETFSPLYEEISIDLPLMCAF